MADQTLAQGSALNRPAAQGPSPGNRLLGKATRSWNLGRCWARYTLAGAHRGVPELVDFVLADHFFSAMQVPDELGALGKILAPLRPEHALEIGTCDGGTLFFLTRLAGPRATIVSIDLPGGEFGGGYGHVRAWLYKRFARRGQRLHLLQGDSHASEMLDRVRAVLAGQALDYLFIDGDHSYAGVKRDFEMYGPLVRKGGLVAFHDIVEGAPEAVGGVPRFWREIKPHHRYIEMIKDPQQGGWGIGVLYVD